MEVFAQPRFQLGDFHFSSHLTYYDYFWSYWRLYSTARWRQLSKRPSDTILAMAEERTYPPNPEFVHHAHVQGMEGYRALYRRALEQPEEFWGELAARELFWFNQWTKVLDWNAPFAKWFIGGKTNVSYNCIDRHLTTDRKNKVAILWEGEPGDQRMISYQELYRLVTR